MSSEVIEYVLVYIGVILTLILLVNPVKYLYTKYVQYRNGKEDDFIAEGFGIVFKKELVLDSSEPLIFRTLTEAREHVKKRKWDEPHAINKMSEDRVEYVYQRWDTKTNNLVLHPLLIRTE